MDATYVKTMLEEGKLDEEEVMDELMTPAEILSMLRNGQVLLHSLTVPEGLTFVQIADLASQDGLTDRAEFLRLVKDREFIGFWQW